MNNPAPHRVPVSGSESIVVDWSAPGGADAVAVFVHGFGSHRRGEKALYFAERFAALGWGFLAMDLRGHGEADGSMQDLTMSRLLEDVAATMDWLPVKSPPRLWIGSSMGASLAAWHLLAHPGDGRGLVMIGPSLRFPAGFAANVPPAELADWRRSGLRRLKNDWIDVDMGYGLAEDAANFDPRRLEREHRVPALIFHGMEDSAVDWQQSLQFVRDCPFGRIDLMLVKGGDHRLTERKQFLFETIVSWWRQLPD